MSKAIHSQTAGSEHEPLIRAFQELIVTRGALRLNITEVSESKTAVKILKRAEKAIQRQALNILIDLHAAGISRSEIGAIYREAEREDARRNGIEAPA